MLKRNVLSSLVAVAGLASAAHAGGGPENVLILINPANAESMYLGHYYQYARNIPSSNVLYIDPAATNYAAFAGTNGNIDAVLGKLVDGRISDHIDYIVVATGQTFYVDAPGLISDGCWPVARFSLTSAYSSAFIRAQVLTATMSSQSTNHYFGIAAQPFDSNLRWTSGSVTTIPPNPRYFISAQLGYTGLRGNTVAEITSMIDSTAVVDGTHPSGNFYYMNTTDAIRNVRSPNFAPAVSSIVAAGGQAQILNGILPDFRHDCLGIMTGWVDPQVDTAIMTLRPGAYCDDLTSYHATFDIPDQTKMSSWIRRGAAGVSGTVEEPCNYTGKFAAPNLNAVYYKGLSLGEAYLRSIAYFPFQSMFQGDPISRPFATLPTVIPNVPSGPVSGTISFTPAVSTTLPGTSIASVEVYVNGVNLRPFAPNDPCQFSTTDLPDGINDLRILAIDNSPVKTVGRWAGTININNHGHIVTLGTPTITGNLSTAFPANVTVSGPGTVQEVRLMRNGRVLASSNTAPASWNVFGRDIGAGRSRVQAEVLYTDGSRALSAPVVMDIAFTAGAPSGQQPVAYNYSKVVSRGQAVTVELPAKFDDDASGATFTLLTSPAQCTVGAGTKGYRIMTPAANASGSESFTFRVNTPSGQSNTATVTLVYTPAYCYANCDSSTASPLLTANDFQCFLNKFAAGDIFANCDNSGTQPLLTANDFQCFLNAYAAGCS